MHWNKDPRYRACGYWRCRIARRIQNQKQVKIGSRYFGVVKSAEEAAAINARGRKLLDDFNARQKEERHAVGA